jgi:hypothetical protein
MPYTMTIFFDEVSMALEAANVLYSTPALHIAELTITDQSGDPFPSTDEPVEPQHITDSWDYIAQRDIATRAAEERELKRIKRKIKPTEKVTANIEATKHIWMSVGCPHCQSRPGRPCVSPNGADAVTHEARRSSYWRMMEAPTVPADGDYAFPAVTLEEM